MSTMKRKSFNKFFHEFFAAKAQDTQKENDLYRLSTKAGDIIKHRNIRHTIKALKMSSAPSKSTLFFFFMCLNV
jgi:hypothetical protein